MFTDDAWRDRRWLHIELYEQTARMLVLLNSTPTPRQPQISFGGDFRQNASRGSEKPNWRAFLLSDSRGHGQGVCTVFGVFFLFFFKSIQTVITLD